ncbi:hypothetical protein NFI96_008544 [Prochilodus magdalenae]|nr:hypothetical protein NFI96_008544 [Prochilodus magdalenae]
MTSSSLPTGVSHSDVTPSMETTIASSSWPTGVSHSDVTSSMETTMTSLPTGVSHSDLTPPTETTMTSLPTGVSHSDITPSTETTTTSSSLPTRALHNDVTPSTETTTTAPRTLKGNQMPHTSPQDMPPNTAMPPKADDPVLIRQNRSWKEALEYCRVGQNYRSGLSALYGDPELSDEAGCRCLH